MKHQQYQQNATTNHLKTYSNLLKRNRRPVLYLTTNMIDKMCKYNLQQLQIYSMPFICRPVDRFPHNNPSPQCVKRQQSEQESEGVSVLGDDNKKSDEVNQGKWDYGQNLRFVLFVHHYQDIFSSPHKRKACKIFKSFSQYLINRTPAQCRSHYQKIIMKYKTITKLKKHYRQIHGEQHYDQQLEKFKIQWGNNHPQSTNSFEGKELKEASIQTEFQGSHKSYCQCSSKEDERNQMIGESRSFTGQVFFGGSSLIQSCYDWNWIYWMAVPNSSLILP